MAPQATSRSGPRPSTRGPLPPLTHCAICGSSTRSWREPAVCTRKECRDELGAGARRPGPDGAGAEPVDGAAWAATLEAIAWRPPAAVLAEYRRRPCAFTFDYGDGPV